MAALNHPPPAFQETPNWKKGNCRLFDVNASQTVLDKNRPRGPRAGFTPDSLFRKGKAQ
jgi:hypothetical protein